MLTQCHLQFVGGILIGFLAITCGMMGAHHHIGFTVASRFTWGMRGSYCKFLCFYVRVKLYTQEMLIPHPLSPGHPSRLRRMYVVRHAGILGWPGDSSLPWGHHSW
jgi:hypothetical protein